MSNCNRQSGHDPPLLRNFPLPLVLLVSKCFLSTVRGHALGTSPHPYDRPQKIAADPDRRIARSAAINILVPKPPPTERSVGEAQAQKSWEKRLAKMRTARKNRQAQGAAFNSSAAGMLRLTPTRGRRQLGEATFGFDSVNSPVYSLQRAVSPSATGHDESVLRATPAFCADRLGPPAIAASRF